MGHFLTTHHISMVTGRQVSTASMHKGQYLTIHGTWAQRSNYIPSTSGQSAKKMSRLAYVRGSKRHL
jgi:hypothetical protein